MKKIISTENAPKAIGPYSQAVYFNGTLYISGQLPINPETGKMPEGIKAQTDQALKNVKAILEEAKFNLNDVVKSTVPSLTDNLHPYPTPLINTGVIS